MILTRRRFLQAAAGTLFVAPAIVKAENIMKIFVPKDIEMLPYRGHFRVPDLRGHFATNPEPLNLPPQREMTATEVLARRDEFRMAWDKRWSGHMVRKQAQDESMRNLNRKIDNDITDRLQGHEITDVWVDESANLEMSYQVNQRTGEVQAAMSRLPGYIPCDGRELSAIEYPELYGHLGNKYG
jgi:hypothetical protein